MVPGLPLSFDSTGIIFHTRIGPQEGEVIFRNICRKLGIKDEVVTEEKLKVLQIPRETRASEKWVGYYGLGKLDDR